MESDAQPDLRTTRRHKASRADSGLDRLPPFSLECERGMLGCQMLAPRECIGELVSRYGSRLPELYYDLRHEALQKCLCEMFDNRDAIDTLTVFQRLKEKQLLEQVGGVAYISQMELDVPSAANLTWYSDKVHDLYLIRKAISFCTTAIARAYEYKGDANLLMDELERDILAIRPNNSTEARPVKDIISNCISDLEKRFQNGDATSGISTGFKDLDYYTDGLIDGELIILTGYDPEKRDSGSVGKTSLAMNMVERILIESQKSVAVFSLEMSAESLVKRLLSSMSRVNIREFIRTSDASGFAKLTLATSQLSKRSLYIDDSSDLTIQQIRARARRLVQKFDIKFFAIDYAQLIVPSESRQNNREQQVSDIFSGLKSMAKELRRPVMVLSQTNEDGKIRESRAGRHHTDKLWVLRPKNGEDTSSDSVACELYLDKERNEGAGKIVNLVFLKNIVRFEAAANTNLISDEDVPNH